MPLGLNPHTPLIGHRNTQATTAFLPETTNQLQLSRWTAYHLKGHQNRLAYERVDGFDVYCRLHLLSS